MTKKPINRGGRKPKKPVGRQLETIPSRLQVTPTYDANGQRLIKSQDSSPPNDTNLVEASSTGQKRKADEQHDEEPPAQRLRTSSQPPKRGLPIKSADGVKAWDKEPDIPCGYRCGKLFRFPSQCEEHEQSHSNEKFDCPGKEEFLCDKFFNTRAKATAHYNQKHRPKGSYVCEWNPRECDASFDKKSQLVEHREQVHKGRFPCPEAEKFDYQTHIGFWYCTVPMCERAVCEWPMGLRDWQRHEKKHEEQGDFAALGERPEPRHLPGGAPGTADIKDMEEEEGLEVQSSADVDKSEKEKSSVTETRDVEVIDFEPFDASLEEHRTKIKARNQECVDKHPELRVSDCRAGLRCLGPRHCDDHGFVVIPCPYNTKISTDTTFYKAWTQKKAPGIRLRSRCASCSAQLRLDEIMKSNLWALPGQKHCCFKSCEKPMKKGLKFCKEHLSKSKNRVKEAYGPSCSDVEIFRKLRALLQSSLAKVWKYDDEGVPVSRMFAAIDKIRSGETSGSDIICLDLEFSASTHRVFEVGACEYESGKTLIEARVKHDVAYDELHRPDPHSSKATQGNVWMSKRTYDKVHSRKSVPHLNVHEIAAKLREAGVGQRTFILAWHNYHADYDLLQAFLEENGHGDILPPRSHSLLEGSEEQKKSQDGPMGQPSGGKQLDITHQQHASTTSMNAAVPATESSSVAQSVGRQQPTNTKKRGRGRRKQQVVGADQPRITNSFLKTPKDK
ncbi:hypothetical protein K4K48_003627 [Colletotrichum sp. SAR 10_66]|nr:hypothetical protein K4K52_007400 [Colletotrichum sp. SAR 10_76]KAJ4999734.1 hypothetical protein K4K48_003627 [Colletotrichum sp. SAR 10_66]